jgi:phenylpyruvate tautomerase PptA (4-oxalocrotonate tautomerase family)
MPHLQLDLPAHYPTQTKRNLAQRFGTLYATIMQTTPDLVDVTIREAGEGGVWHCGHQEPVPAAVLSLDIRSGRPPGQRARLAEALHDACVEILGLDPLHLSVEFTQHSGDEIYRKILVDGVIKGGLGRNWSPLEVETPLLSTLRAEAQVGRQVATSSGDAAPRRSGITDCV